MALVLSSNRRARGALLRLHGGLKGFHWWFLFAFCLRHGPNKLARLLGCYPCLKSRFEGDPVNAEKFEYRRSRKLKRTSAIPKLPPSHLSAV